MFFTDQLNNTFELNEFPKRIISIVPSQSELMWELGLKDEIIGITKFCIHPKVLHNTITHVGGTKTLNLDKIRALNPDIIIGNKEENDKTQIETLQKEFKVWMSDIYTLSDSLSMIKSLGQLVGKKEQAIKLSNILKNSFLNLKKCNKTVLYFIWNTPYMVAGKATFIGNILDQMGLINCISDKDSRYPCLTIETIVELNPEIIFLSTEPFPFNNNHIEELKIKLPNTHIMLVDGELFSWYGSRLTHSVVYLNSLINKIS